MTLHASCRLAVGRVGGTASHFRPLRRDGGGDRLAALPSSSGRQGGRLRWVPSLYLAAEWQPGGQILPTQEPQENNHGTSNMKEIRSDTVQPVQSAQHEAKRLIVHPLVVREPDGHSQALLASLRIAYDHQLNVLVTERLRASYAGRRLCTQGALPVRRWVRTSEMHNSMPRAAGCQKAVSPSARMPNVISRDVVCTMRLCYSHSRARPPTTIEATSCFGGTETRRGNTQG